MEPQVSSSSEDPLKTSSVMVSNDDTISNDDTVSLHSIESSTDTRRDASFDSELACICWKTAYANLKAYVEQHGKLPTARECAWVSKQRVL